MNRWMLIVICGITLLACRVPCTLADEDAAVHVTFSAGSAEIANIKVGESYFSRPTRALRGFPKEIEGLAFTRRPMHELAPNITLDIPAGATVYLLCSDKTERTKFLGSLPLLGWSRLSDEITHVSPTYPNFAVFKQRFSTATHLEIDSDNIEPAIDVAAKNLVLEGDDKPTEKKPAPQKDEATPFHTDKPTDTDAVAGPTTHPAIPQASITCLEVYKLDSGLMLGRTSEAVLTVAPSESAKHVTVRFVTPVGDQMTLARDEALRYIHVRYPNWYANQGEISFEDKYDNHEGGSNGTAVGTMVLSIIQGFSIDPAVAVTGDISANGKVRAIGGVAAKLRGAIDGKCTCVALPMENEGQLTDAVVYSGQSLITDIQALGITNLDDAVATLRVDRDAKLTEAISLFSEVQSTIKDKPAALKTAPIIDKLEKILFLTPQHLSAKLLLDIALNKFPKTLSATASQYYTFVAVRNMTAVLNQRADSNEVRNVPSSVVRSGLADLRKLRPLADATVRPLIDAWCRFIEAWNDQQQAVGNAQSTETARQALLDESAKEDSNAEQLQERLREGM